MATHGLLLYSFTLHEGQKHRPTQLGNADGRPFMDVLVEAVDALVLTGTLTGGAPRDDEPDGAADDEKALADKQAKVLRVESSVDSGRTVLCTVRAGREGTHDIAVSTSGEADLNLKGRAPTRLHRVLFVVPPGGTIGLVLVEVVSGARPLSDLVRWLKHSTEKRWRLRLSPSMDEASFREALDRSRDIYLELDRLLPSDDNTPTKHKKLRLYAPLTTKPVRDAVKSIVTSWLPTERIEGQEVPDPAEEANKLAQIVDKGFSHVTFDDGRVVAEEEDGITRSFKPRAKFDLFQYYLGDERPSDAEFISRATAIAERSFQAHDIELHQTWRSERS